MAGSIHKEALADAKRLREVAETNAKNIILERITPTIKNMIEKELLGESTLDMEEDVLISPEEKEKETKEEGHYNEGQEELTDNVQLTVESVDALASMKSIKAEQYGVRALRISNKIEKLHEAKINDITYGEKLRQIKNEIEKTFTGLQEDVEKNIVPDNSSKLIINKLEELYEITNKLMVPVKVRLIKESNDKIVRKYNQFKVIAEEYGLTKEAGRKFGEEWINLTKEAKSLFESVTELKEVVEDSTVNKFETKIKGLFKEIYEMANKFGTLNEEELKVVISGLDPDDPEGSALTAMVEPSEEDELEDDDLGGEDLDGEDLGGDDLGDDMEDDMMNMDEMMYEEDALDELLGGSSYRAGGGKGRSGGKMAAIAAKREKERKEKESKEKDDALDELLGGNSYRAGGGRGRSGGKMAALAAQREKERKAKEDKDEEPDEVLEISETMLKQELLKLRKRRAAMNEAMKAMQSSPGGGPGALDNFGGAGRQLGGGVDGELFVDYDSDDMNDLDPVGTGYPVNEAEDALDELLGGSSYKAGGGKGRSGGKMAALAAKREKERKAKEKESKEKESVDEVTQELAETVRAYKGVFGKMRSDNNKLAEELRRSNLSNAKLVYATKLMQNENLSEKQRLVVVEHLDQAKSVREVKKLFTALKEALESKGNKSKLTEGRTVIGGSSKPSKSGASTLSESETKEFTRWGELAGFLNG